VTAWKSLPDSPRDYATEKGRPRMDIFWSLAFPNGIRCTVGVHPGTMSQ